MAFYVSTGAEPRSCCRSRGRGRPGPAADQGHPQRQRSRPGAPGVGRRVRVAAALSGGDGRPDPAGTSSAVVVDAAPSTPPADLSRGAPHVRAGQRSAGTTATLHSLRHTAAYRMAEDPALALTDVQAVVGHAQLTHHSDLPHPPQGGRGPSGVGPPRLADPPSSRALTARRRTGIPAGDARGPLRPRPFVSVTSRKRPRSTSRSRISLRGWRRRPVPCPPVARHVGQQPASPNRNCWPG